MKNKLLPFFIIVTGNKFYHRLWVSTYSFTEESFVSRFVVNITKRHFRCFEIWGFHSAEDTSQVLLDCDAV